MRGRARKYRIRSEVLKIIVCVGGLDLFDSRLTQLRVSLLLTLCGVLVWFNYVIILLKGALRYAECLSPHIALKARIFGTCSLPSTMVRTGLIWLYYTG